MLILLFHPSGVKFKCELTARGGVSVTNKTQHCKKILSGAAVLRQNKCKQTKCKLAG